MPKSQDVGTSNVASPINVCTCRYFFFFAVGNTWFSYRDYAKLSDYSATSPASDSVGLCNPRAPWFFPATVCLYYWYIFYQAAVCKVTRTLSQKVSRCSSNMIAVSRFVTRSKCATRRNMPCYTPSTQACHKVAYLVQSYTPAFLKLWFADHKWSSGSALVVLLDWTLVQKRQKNKINVNCVSHTIVENLKQSLEITYNKRL